MFKRCLTYAGLGVAALSLLAGPAWADTAPHVPTPLRSTTIGNVTIGAAYREVSSAVVSVRSRVLPGHPYVPERVTTLVPASAGPDSGCVIKVNDEAPGVYVYSGVRYVEGYSDIEVGTGCSSVTWKHYMLEYKYVPSLGKPTWVHEGGTYEHTVTPGHTDFDNRTVACSGDSDHDWWNKTNLSSGVHRDVACYR